MPYVYKYTDTNDGIVKYVGIIKKDSNFPGRFFQHKSDKWSREGKWKIEYISVDSITDAEALEGHFIWLYGTGEHYNKAKKEWGRCSFAPELTEFKWTLYKDGLFSSDSLADRTSNIFNELYSMSRRQEELWREYEIIKERVNKESLASIRRWFDDCVIDPGQVFFTWQRNHNLSVSAKSYDFLFENYLEWAKQNYTEYTILSVEEFTSVIKRNSHLKNFCQKDNVQQVILIGSDEYNRYQTIREEVDKEDLLKIAKIFELSQTE